MLSLLDNEIKTILFIDDNIKNIHKLSRATNITYCHQFKVIEKLTIKKLVETKKEGRQRTPKLTEKGKKVKYHLLKLNQI